MLKHPRLSIVTFLITLYTATMVAIAFSTACGATSWIHLLVYNSTAVAHGQLWRLGTYALISSPSIWFALEMAMLYYFGRVVEKAIGSKMFAFLYGGLLLLGSLLLQLWSSLGEPQQMNGAQAANFAIFAAFVALCPDIPFFFALRARSLLLILLAVTSLQLVEGHHFASLLLFLSASLAALLFMHWRGFPSFFSSAKAHPVTELLKKMTSLKKEAPPTNSTLLASASISTSILPFVSPKTPKKKSAPPKKKIDIDALLEKINQTGIASLTEQEKEKLEEARVALLKRDGVSLR